MAFHSLLRSADGRKYVKLAMEEYDRDPIRFLANNKRDVSTIYDLVENGKTYPPKAIMMYAHKLAMAAFPEPSSGGTKISGGIQSNAPLVKMGYEVVRKTANKKNDLLKDYVDEELIDFQEDRRTRIEVQVAARPGQGEFRRKLLEVYGSRCAITGCKFQTALEAAHIMPFKGAHTNTVENGILLRSDLHVIFDSGLLMFDVENWKVFFHKSLSKEAEYAKYHKCKILLPNQNSDYPTNLMKYKPEYSDMEYDW